MRTAQVRNVCFARGGHAEGAMKMYFYDEDVGRADTALSGAWFRDTR